jgi:sarcosine oxidase, subunit beta
MIKNSAEVVIIGGGVVGCSIAYNLAKQGCKDVIVIEKNFLASGSSGRCAAGIRQQWGTEMNCKLAKGSMEIFENMNEILQADRSIDLKQGGYLLLAFSDEELEQFRKNIKLQHKFNIPSREIDFQEAREIVPYINLEGVTGAAFSPTDGHANPFYVTQAYAEAAKKLGVEIYTFTKVLGIDVENDKIVGVKTDKGYIKTDTVVNAAGGFAKEIANMVGVNIPVKPERHEILVTEPVNQIQGPMVMSFSYNIYCQQTPDGSFLMGYGPDNPPESHSANSSWGFLEIMARKTTKILPLLRNLRVVRQWAGSYIMTPDSQPILDESKEIERFYMAVGFSGHGFMISPMTGKIMAEMITGNKLSIDLKLELERFEKGNLILEPSVV